jgi:hypothetical protein
VPDAFFHQIGVVLVKREVLRYSLVDNKASIPLLHIGNRIERLQLALG